MTFVCLADDWHDWLFVHDILEGEGVKYTEGKLDTQLEPFILVSILDSFAQYRRTVRQQLGIEFGDGPGVG